MKKLITIQPAYDIFGRWWAYINENGEEIGSDNKDFYSLEDAKKRAILRFGDIKIKVDGKKIVN